MKTSTTPSTHFKQATQPQNKRCGSARRSFLQSAGFTLVELMVVVVIIGVLSSIALPSYSDSVYRAKMRTAQMDLVGMVLQMEGRFSRTLSYAPATENTTESKEELPAWNPASSITEFTFLISESSGTSYTLEAEGIGQMSGCTLSITNTGVKTASGCDQGGGSWL